MSKNYALSGDMQNAQISQPQIRQTLFIVDQNRKYLFDVNQNITIKKLKRMIVAAADLNRVGLRIFHNGVEYTNYDDQALDQLFPNLQLVEFYIQYSYDNVEDLEEIIDLKLLQYCDLHNGKYPYFYCFTCGKSICSDCLRSGAHNNHETKEKYDYLQESRNLVELLFKDLKDIFNNVKGDSKDSVEELKAKVSIQFFPQLIQMVKQIEQKMMNLILFFLEKEKGNFKTIEDNIDLLKNHCQEGLDKLKKEIVIEDIMIDENVFLTFHNKFKEIGREKEKFKDDIEKYKKFSENLYIIKSIIEKTYKEIYDFLLRYLNVTEFEDIKNKIDSENISIVDKKRIFDKLLSNIKKRSGSEIRDIRRKSYVPPKTEEFNIGENINQKVNILPDNNQKENSFNYMPNYGYSNNSGDYNNNYNNNFNNFNQNNYSNNYNNNYPSSNVDEYNYNNTALTEEIENDNLPNKNIKLIKNEKTILKTNNPQSNIPNNNNITYNYSIDNTNNNYEQPNYNLRNSNNKMSNQINANQFYQVAMEEDKSKSPMFQPIYQVVCNVIPSKNQIILFNVDQDTIMRKNIEFSQFIGINHFLEESAWVNHNNKLYILGGMDDFNQSSKIFLEYDPYKNIIKRLPDSKYTHSRHSLFAYNNEIFVVGGDRLECEKYDIINNEWKTLPNLAFKQIYPVLYIHNDVLYSFFGIDDSIQKTDNIQKLILNKYKSKWTKLDYKRNGCNLFLFGCGVAEIDDNNILFLGGMDDNGVRDETIKFDFDKLAAYKTNYKMEQKGYFKDSVLLKLNSKHFGNFSIEDKNPFLKISINSS